MLKYERLETKFDVIVTLLGSEHLFGRIVQEHGFVVSRAYPQGYLEVQPKDLADIARKTGETMEFGMDPPKCAKCMGTPYYPIVIRDGGKCDESFHKKVDLD
jgi:hypothetical protein